MAVKHDAWRSTRRLPRRRLLAAGGGAGLLAACSGAASKPGGGATKSAASRTPQRGGTMVINLTYIPPGLDPFRTPAIGTLELCSFVYSRLLKFQTGPGVDPTLYAPVPDLAASYESPDPVTWNFKLRPDAKMHDVPPTNGRPVTAEDVASAFQRFNASPTNSNKSDLSVIDSVTAVDAQTAQFKLKFPYAPFLDLMASPRDLWIIPHELDEAGADKGGDAQKHMVGSGPFIFKSYQQAQTANFARNPNYWVKDSAGQALPYLGAINVTFLTDANAILSQFQAGHIDALTSQSVSLSQIQGAKKQDPRLQELTNLANSYTNIICQPTTYTANQPPFNDVRVRRALSLAIDRDALNKQLFNSEGGWDDVAIPAGFAYWWLDPKGKDIGPGGAWYKYDPAQAKQLLTAAGFGNGLTVPFHYTNAFGATWNQLYDALPGMLQPVGITLKMVLDNYQSVFIPADYAGHFDGLDMGPIGNFYDPDTYFTQALTPGGSWNSSKVNDREVNRLLDQERRELDRAKRRDLVWQIQRRAADQVFQIPLVTGRIYQLVPPAIHDFYSNGSSYGIGTEVYLPAWKEQ